MLSRLSVLSTALLVLALLVSGALSSELEVTTTANLTSMPLAFTKNQGQWDSQVIFRADAGRAAMWFTADGAYYQFTRTVTDSEAEAAADPIGFAKPRIDNIEMMMIRASFVEANLSPSMRGEGLLDYKCNYFLGNDPAGWRTDVPNYGAVVYQQIYPGIDLKYYGNGREMEYDFIVSPGADPSQIRIQYEGVESVFVNADGELVVTTAWGEVIERRPVVYQLQDNARMPLEGQYRLDSDNAFGFSLGSEYDPSLPLVIDPVLSYSTYLGGTYGEGGQGIAVDNSGCAYVTGVAWSSDFPTTPGSYEEVYQQNGDAFVTKLNSTGNDLIYSTYLGGGLYETGIDIAVDTQGCAFVVGVTYSEDYPTSGDAYQTEKAGYQDVFVTKLNSSGSGLGYSTYLGGTEEDFGTGIALSWTETGLTYAHITGRTLSPDFPLRWAFQGDQGGEDAFVARLNPSGTDLVYSTYLGGSQADMANGITHWALGIVAVTGYTESTDFPLEGSSYQDYQGNGDAFVTVLAGTGDEVLWSTCLGGSEHDAALDIQCALDGSSYRVYVCGHTHSTDFPTPGGLYTTHHGSVDGFVSKLNMVGGDLIYGTYLGGSDGEWCWSIAPDGSGCAYVAGQTSSADFPTRDAFQTLQGLRDGFVAKLRTEPGRLSYSTYLGGTDLDEAYDIAIDTSGAAYVIGTTQSTDFPLENPFEDECPYYMGAFVSKLVSRFGTISGTVTDGTSGLWGVTVSLYDESVTLVEVTTTDLAGVYSFLDVIPGDYLVTIVVPPGYEVASGGESQVVTVVTAQTSVADFVLTETIEPEFESFPKTRGFWAHQVNGLVTGQGTVAVEVDSMCKYLDDIEVHFNEHPSNPVIIVPVSAETDCVPDRLLEMQSVIAPKQNPTDADVARAHLAALLLNVVSVMLLQEDVISVDGATVSQAITHCNLLLTDFTEINDDSAKVIAETINKGQMVAEDWIPLTTPHILYKPEDGRLPMDFALGQNYPNPFNPVTGIEFALPRACHTRLEIFNIVGQRVEILIDRHMPAGYHAVLWDGTKMASGIYLYRLMADDFVQSRKMMLIK